LYFSQIYGLLFEIQVSKHFSNTSNLFIGCIDVFSKKIQLCFEQCLRKDSMSAIFI